MAGTIGAVPPDPSQPASSWRSAPHSRVSPGRRLPEVKLFLIELAVIAIAGLLAASHFLHSRRAKFILGRLRLAGWTYVAMVLALAALQLLRGAPW